jgi:hypothetical protein
LRSANGLQNNVSTILIIAIAAQYYYVILTGYFRLLAWVDTGLNFTTKRTDVLSTIYFPYKSFAYDGNNRFGVLGGYGVPLMSFSVTEDLKFVTLDKYDLPESRHSKLNICICVCIMD